MQSLFQHAPFLRWYMRCDAVRQRQAPTWKTMHATIIPVFVVCQPRAPFSSQAVSDPKSSIPYGFWPGENFWRQFAGSR